MYINETPGKMHTSYRRFAWRFAAPAPMLARTVLGVLAISALPLHPAAAGSSVYTATGGKACHVLPEGHLSGRRCKGPGNLSFVILDDGNVVGVEFGLPGKEAVASGMHWRAVGQLIGTRIEWRMSRGRPYAAILRIFTVDDEDRPVQRLFVAKVTPQQSCQIANVDADQRNATQIARRVADRRARPHRCRPPE